MHSKSLITYAIFRAQSSPPLPSPPSPTAATEALVATVPTQRITRSLSRALLAPTTIPAAVDSQPQIRGSKVHEAESSDGSSTDTATVQKTSKLRTPAVTPEQPLLPVAEQASSAQKTGTEPVSNAQASLFT